MRKTSKSLTVLHYHISLRFLWHRSWTKTQNFALLFRNRNFRTLLYRKWLAQRFMGHRILSWWTEPPHSFYLCLCCNVCWGRCVSNWEWSKPSDAVARVKRERLIPIVLPSMHHKCDEEFPIPYVGCILSTTRGALHAGVYCLIKHRGPRLGYCGGYAEPKIKRAMGVNV